MKWFELSIKKLKDMSARASEREKLEDALDFKYGNYDYNEDARSLEEVKFDEIFLSILSKNILKPKEETKILLAGSNNGYEYNLLKGFQVTPFDLSKKALQKLKETFPEAESIHGNIEELPFEDNSFDVYISMRNIHSTNVNLERALSESLRVVKKDGVLIYSVSNAYKVDGKLVKGMYDEASSKFDEQKPYLIAEKIKKFLEDNGLKTEVIDIPSEIILVAKK